MLREIAQARIPGDAIEVAAEIVALLVERVTATRTTGRPGSSGRPRVAPFFRVVLSEWAVWDSNPRHED